MLPTSTKVLSSGPVTPRPAGTIALGLALCAASVLMLLVASGIDVGRPVVAIVLLLVGGVSLVLRSLRGTTAPAAEQSSNETAPTHEGAV